MFGNVNEEIVYSSIHDVQYGCLCVCVHFLPFYSGRQVRWMYQPGWATQEEGHTGFFIDFPSAVLAFVQQFLSLVDREIEFCVVTI